MSRRKLIDINLIVRYLVQDHERHAKAAERLFDTCDRTKVVIVVLPAVLAECVSVLESFYEHAMKSGCLSLKLNLQPQKWRYVSLMPGCNSLSRDGSFRNLKTGHEKVRRESVARPTVWSEN